MHVGDRTLCLSFLPCTQPSTIEEPAEVSRIVGRESVTGMQVRDVRSVHKTGLFLACCGGGSTICKLGNGCNQSSLEPV
ncbi:unnamed protein product [Sphagnum troendelagicum]|uniref:Uncharacterized protein n=1 Tax=Sphagnum troendelagicum TaxID=128251 RepID=A0ABP0U826_9BRYO